jgi:hypothetical protein
MGQNVEPTLHHEDEVDEVVPGEVFFLFQEGGEEPGTTSSTSSSWWRVGSTFWPIDLARACYFTCCDWRRSGGRGGGSGMRLKGMRTGGRRLCGPWSGICVRGLVISLLSQSFGILSKKRRTTLELLLYLYIIPRVKLHIYSSLSLHSLKYTIRPLNI